MKELLQVTRLSAGYGRRQVLDRLTFSVGRGEVCALLGANGSGKSTLLKAVCGLVDAQGGCSVEGRSLGELPPRRRARWIGYLAQRSSCSLALTALEVVLMGYNPVLGLFQKPNQLQRRQGLELLEELGGGDWAEKDFLSLSEGQRQLVLFARTLVRRPPLLLLDEPDSALDYDNRHRLLRWLTEYARREGAGVLMCSHDANIALRYAHRLLLLKEGRLTGDLAMAEVPPSSLAQALRELYGPVDLLRHGNHFLMTRGEGE